MKTKNMAVFWCLFVLFLQAFTAGWKGAEGHVKTEAIVVFFTVARTVLFIGLEWEEAKGQVRTEAIAVMTSTLYSAIPYKNT
ncbi:hypothetical protein PG991_010368 [Apiospora marii]|uniref:Uncharacterized protein n=1 Tax=Apiospora marii TaxID=335849 RepID=A0ABR1RIH2_9PEZI